MQKQTQLADELWPLLLPRVRALITGNGRENGGTVQLSSHALTDHTGQLSDNQAPQFLLRNGIRSLTGNLAVDSGITIDGVDISAHAADPNVHHAQVHNIIGSDHTLTSAKWGLIGATATNTLGVLTPLADVSGTTKEAILKSDASGQVKLVQITTTTSVSTPLIDTETGPLTLQPANRIVKIGSVIEFSTSGNIAIEPDIQFTGNAFIASEGSLYVSLDSDNNVTGDSFIIGHGSSVTGGFVETFRLTNTGTLRFTADAPIITTTANDLTIDPAGRTLFADNKQVRSETHMAGFLGAGFSISWPLAGKAHLDIRSAYMEELEVTAFQADIMRLRIAEDFLAQSMGHVSRDFTTPATIGGAVHVYFENNPAFDGQIFLPNEWVMFQSIQRGTGLSVAQLWGQVTDYSVAGLTDEQRWTFTLRSGPTGRLIKKATVALSFGASGSGYIHHNVLRSANGPWTRYATWSGSDPFTPANRRVHAQGGNLNGLVDISTDRYGFAAGNNLGLVPTNGFSGFIADDVGGLRLFNTALALYSGATKTVDISPTGNIKLGTNVANGLTTTFDFISSTGVLRVGPGSGGPTLNWTGTNLAVRNSSGVDVILLNNTGDSYFSGIMQIAIGGEIRQGTVTSGHVRNAWPLVGYTGLRIWRDGDIGRIGGYKSNVLQWYADTLGEFRAGEGLVAVAADGFSLARYITPAGTPVAGTESKAALAWWDDINNRSGAPISRIYAARSQAGTGGIPSLAIEVDQANTDADKRPSLWIIGGNIPQMWFNNIYQIVGIPGFFPTRNFITFEEIVQLTGRTILQKTLERDANIATIDLGTAGNPFRAIHVNTVYADAITGTAMTGQTWTFAGDMGIAPNSESNTVVYIANSGTGAADLQVERDIIALRNIVVNGTVDGVDVSVLNSSYTSHAANANAHHDQQHGLDSSDHTGTLSWSKVAKTGSSLEDLVSRSHSALTDIGPNDHHNQDHVLATNIGLGPDHSISGAQAGWVLRASSGTAAAFAQLAHSDLSGLTAGDPHTQYALRSRQILPGNGLTGGGDFSADRTLTVGAGDGITVATNSVGVNSSVARNTWPIIAGNGLTGGGNLSAAGVTLTVGAGDLITVGTSTVGVSKGTAQYQVPVTGASPFTPVYTLLSSFAGNGLDFLSGKFVVGAGTLITVGATTVGLSNGSTQYQIPVTGASPFTPAYTPLSSFAGNGLEFLSGKFTVGTTGLGLDTTTTQVRLTSSSNPGASARILATNDSGELTLSTLKMGGGAIYSGSGNTAVIPDIQFTGNAFIASEGGIYVALDSDNNSSTTGLIIGKDSNTTVDFVTLFVFDEAGIATITGKVRTPIIETASGVDLSVLPATKTVKFGDSLRLHTTNNILTGPDISFANAGLITAADGLYLVVDSTNTGGGAFTFAKGANTSAAASVMMTLTNTGRLGIGQASPSYTLDVTGEARATVALRTATAYASTKVETPTISTASGPLTLAPANYLVKLGGGVELYTTNDIGVNPDIYFPGNSVIATENTLYVLIDATNSGVGNLVFGKGNRVTTGINTLMTLTNAGNFGIGMSPVYRLDVSGEMRATTAVRTATAYVSGSVETPLITTTSGNLQLSPMTGITTLSSLHASTSIRSPLFDTASGVNMVIAPAGDLYLSPVGLDTILQQTASLRSQDFNKSILTTGFRIGPTDLTGQTGIVAGMAEFDELRVRIFVADETRVDRGQWYLAKSYGILSRPFTVPAAVGDFTNIHFENSPHINGALFSVNDWIMLSWLNMDGGITLTKVWGQVNTYTALANGEQRWRFYLRSGTPGLVFAKGSLGLDFGAPGQGYILMDTVTSTSPSIIIGRWTGTDPFSPGNHQTLTGVGSLAMVGFTGEYGLAASVNGYGVDAPWAKIGTAGAQLNNLPFIFTSSGVEKVHIGGWNDVWMGPDITDKRFEFDGNSLKLRSSLLMGNSMGVSLHALLHCSFDAGDPRFVFSGSANGHLGQAATFIGKPGFRSGKFGGAFEATRTTTNLVTNSSFESDAIGASPAGWDNYTNNLGGGTVTGSNFVANDHSYDGRQCLKIVKNDGTVANPPVVPAGRIGRRKGVTVTPGTTYAVSAWVRLGTLSNPVAGQNNAILYAQSGSGETLVSASAGTAAQGGWQELKFKIIPTTTTLSVYVWLSSCDAGEMFVDAVQVTANAYFPYWLGEQGTRPGSYASLGELAGFNWQKFTISSWFRLADLPSSSFGVNSYISHLKVGGSGVQLLISSLDRLYAYYDATDLAGNPVSKWTSAPENKAITDDAWHHVAAVVDYPKLYLYLDGELMSWQTLTAVGGGVPNVYIGANHSGSRPWNGWIDDYAIIPRPLSPSEIAQIAQGDAPIRALASASELMLSDTGIDGDLNTVSAHAGGLFGKVITATGVETASFALFNRAIPGWGGFTNLNPGDLVLGHNKAASAAIRYDRTLGVFGFYGNNNPTPQVTINNDGTLTAINANISGVITVTGGNVATTAALNTGLAGKANTSDLTSGLAGKVNTGGAAADVNANTTTISGGKITAGSITALQIAANAITTAKLDFIPVTSTNVVASINATAEGVRIAGNRIQIDGNVTFSSGYDPTTKADATTTANALAAKAATTYVDQQLALKASLTYVNQQLATATAPLAAITYVDDRVTNIDGGSITTGTINANRIGAVNLAVLQAAVGELSALSADLGNVTAGQIVVGNATNKLWFNGADAGDLAIGGNVKANAPFKVSAAGALTATSGAVGGWTITSSSIMGTRILLSSSGEIRVGNSGNNYAGIYAGNTSTDIAFWAGKTPGSWSIAPYRVQMDGYLYAENAEIAGIIKASSGFIGGTTSGWTIATGKISSSNIELISGTDARLIVGSSGSNYAGVITGNAATDVVFWAGSAYGARSSSSKFRVQLDGKLVATNAVLIGTLTATNGSVSIDDDGILIRGQSGSIEDAVETNSYRFSNDNGDVLGGLYHSYSHSLTSSTLLLESNTLGEAKSSRINIWALAESDKLADSKIRLAIGPSRISTTTYIDLYGTGVTKIAGTALITPTQLRTNAPLELYNEAGTVRNRIVASALFANTTTDNGYKLDINGIARITSDITLGGVIYLAVVNTPSAAAGHIAIWFDGTNLKGRLPNGSIGTFTLS